jgi:hypothetical protein
MLENMEPGIELRERRETRPFGQLLTITALAPTGRVLAVVEIHVPLAANFNLAERIGGEATAKIEDDARDLATRIALGVQTSPQTKASA